MVLCMVVLLTHSPQAWSEDKSGAGGTAFAAPENGGPRRLQLTSSGELELRKLPAEQAPTLRMLGSGTILSNLGCEPVDDRVWCKVRPLRGRTPGFVEAANLGPATGSDGTVPKGIDDSRLRAQQGEYDVTGLIACAQIQGQPLGECAFGVARSDGGDATVTVTFSNGFRRMLFFAHGEFISGDATMSGTGRDTDWRVVDSQHIIRVDDQRYELPDSAIFGN